MSEITRKRKEERIEPFVLLPLIFRNTNTTLLDANNWKFTVPIQTKLNLRKTCCPLSPLVPQDCKAISFNGFPVTLSLVVPK